LASIPQPCCFDTPRAALTLPRSIAFSKRLNALGQQIPQPVGSGYEQFLPTLVERRLKLSVVMQPSGNCRAIDPDRSRNVGHILTAC
jgi:hypothetical protein